MWDFSDDEWVFFFVTGAVFAVGGFLYYRPLFQILSFRTPMLRRCALGCLPLVALIPTYVVLSRWADAQVVGHPDYMILFLVGGGAWIFAAGRFMPVLGISIRDDALERNNLAALTAISGILLGVGIIYAFSNIGSGATIWTTILPALVATVLLFVLSLLIELSGGRVAEAITIDRDVAAAMRLAGALLGCAIILGFVTSGDWISWNQTWADFVSRGWPAVLLAGAAGAAHRLLRPTPLRFKPRIFLRGVLPSLLFILTAILIVIVGRRGLYPNQW